MIFLEESVQYWYLFLFPPPPLPCSSSTCRQTNEDSTGNVSDDSLKLSRIEPLHHLLDVLDFHVEEDEPISSIFHNRRANIPLVQHRSKFFSQWELFLENSRPVLFFVVLLWLLIGMQNLSHPISTHILRAELLKVPARCCSNSSQTCLIHEKF